jgi:hypothetical protein
MLRPALYGRKDRCYGLTAQVLFDLVQAVECEYPLAALEILASQRLIAAVQEPCNRILDRSIFPNGAEGFQLSLSAWSVRELSEEADEGRLPHSRTANQQRPRARDHVLRSGDLTQPPPSRYRSRSPSAAVAHDRPRAST